jgi:hypothetical protein
LDIFHGAQKTPLLEALPNNSRTIARDIADLCWVVAIGDGRSPILEALVPSSGYEYTGIQGSGTAETFGCVWGGF